MPSKCPECGQPVERREGEVAYYCTNPNCYAQRRRGVEHFVAKGAMNIDGLGPQIVDKLFQTGLMKDAADLYALTVEDLMSLEGFKEKSSQNLVEAIGQRRSVPLQRFFTALGIRLVGSGVAELIVKHLAQAHWSQQKTISIKKFVDVIGRQSVDDFEAIDGVGAKVGESIAEFFSDTQNKHLFAKFDQHGLKLEVPHVSKRPLKLAGLKFVLTGTLPKLSREEAIVMIKAEGGSVSGSVSSKTDYVVAGDDPGSKFEKAKKLGVKIIGEQELRKLV